MLRRAVLVALVLAAALPASAQAADTTISFDDLPAGTIVRDQYQAQGVVFGDAASFGFPTDSFCTPTAPIAEAASPSFGASAPNVAVLRQCGGSTEFPNYGTMGAFSSFRSRISARVASASGSPAGDTSVVLKVYDVHRNLLATSSEVPVTPGPAQTVSIDVGTPEIAFFVVQRLGQDREPAAIDDFTFDNPPVPPDPEISVGVDTNGFDVRADQGGTQNVPVRILRFNGSSGNVSLTVDGLPAGISSATFSPNPAGGSSFVTTSTLTLHADTDAPTGTSQPTIHANPVASAGSSPDSTSFGLDVVPPFTLTGPTAGSVAPCTPSSVPLNLNVEPDFTDPITISVSSSSPTVTASLPATFTPGFSPPITSLPLTAPYGAGKGDASVTVTATSGPFTQQQVISVDRFPGAINTVKLATVADIQPTDLIAPYLNVPGTYLHLIGSGFCPSSTVRFGPGDATGAPLQDISADGTNAFVRVPLTATNGPLALINSDSDGTSPDTAKSRAVNVHGFRNTRGFQFKNFQSAGPSWDDVVSLYGHSQTDIQVDPCAGLTLGLASCDLGPSLVPSPPALVYWRSISDYGKNGNCWGVVMSSFFLSTGRKSVGDFGGSPGGTTYGLDTTTGPTGNLRAYIRLIHIEQASREGITVNRVTFGHDTEGTLLVALQKAFQQGHPALVSIRQGDSGHAVLAYATTPTTKGYDIEVYNPNTPYASGEDSSSATHSANLENSRVHVTGSGWSFPELNWSGGFDQIGAYDATFIPPDHPTLPDTLGDYLEVIAAPDTLGVTRLTDPAGHPIHGSVDLPNAGGPGGGPMIHLVPRGHSVHATLHGRGALGVFANGHAFGLDGSAHGLSLRRGAGVLDVQGGAKGLHVTATTRTGGANRVATATLGSPGGAGLGFGAGGAIVLRSGAGPVTVSLTFGQVGRHSASSAVLRRVRIARGETLTLRPLSWAHPGRLIATASVRGRVRRLRLTARAIRASAAIRSLRLTATPGRRAVLVQGRLRVASARGSAATGALVWQLRAGRRVLRHGRVTLSAAQLRGARAFRFTVRAPRGSYRLDAAAVVGDASPTTLVPTVSARRTTIGARVR